MKLSDLDLSNRLFHLRSKPEINWATKNRKERALRLNRKLCRILAKDLAKREECEVWFLDDGSGSLAYSSVDALANPIGKALNQLGISRPKPLHGLRGWAITRLLKRGVELSVVQEYVGHEDIKTTKGYRDAIHPDELQVSDLL